ncbi:EF-hand [Westerdykella ornata]|uniref:EF-hand n=1 Tax=Westerdykella ornata TaxID=318751 RepID=A0A6A6JR80_WESOR|nr:EF-hand [Westerdykella ornata]KAF2279141.1 EF-hand [Westerdykella ornata]
MSTTPTPYKPSPLSFNSPRTSPFRRQNSSAQSPSGVRPTTPTSSPLKPPVATTPTPSHTPARDAATSDASNKPPPWLSTRGTLANPEPPRSPTRQVSSSTQHTVRPMNTASIASRFETPSPGNTPSVGRPATRPVPAHRPGSSDALSKIPAPLLHSMRESFSVLDRDNNGSVDASDVADMLSQLGLTATPATLSSYFHDSQSINLATYLNTLSDLLSGLSHVSELNAAFEAFDDGDDGQIDLAELKDALLHTAPEPGERKLTEREIDMVVEGFSGRRAFTKGGKGINRGEVFRYQEFVANITGGGASGENGTGAPAQV